MPEKTETSNYDVAIIGAGINGAVSAAALASRGLRVLIVDRGDYAGVTSSQSSNLIWGGIKYLQSYEFWLVFKLSRARAKLMKNYPTRIRSVGFLAALGPNAPFGVVLGTFGTLFYWFIGLFTTPLPKTYGLTSALKIEPKLGLDRLRGAVEYFDAMMPDNDSRFVWDFISKAKGFGAQAMNYQELIAANKIQQGFELTLKDSLTGETSKAISRVVINSAGPFAKVINDNLGVETKKGLVFSKGIHLVVPKLTSDGRILAFWDEQDRLFYVIPMHDRSVIGTTDTRVTDPSEEVTQADRDFVLKQINISMNLETPLTTGDIISERCGVRALVVDEKSDGDNADWHKLSRKHSVLSDESGVISILGGKFTDCLNVGHEILREVKRFIPVPKTNINWVGEESEKELALFQSFAKELALGTSLSEEIISQLWRRHGSRAKEILTKMQDRESDLEPVFEGLAITYGEIRHISETEDVRSQQDLLRRRLPIAMVRSDKEIRENQKLQNLLGEMGLI